MAKRTRPSKANFIVLACVLAITCCIGSYYLNKGDRSIKANNVALIRSAKAALASPPPATSAPRRRVEPIAASHAVTPAEKAELKRLMATAAGSKAAGAPLGKIKERPPLRISPLKENLQPADQGPQDPNDMTLAVAFENQARKSIRAFEGVLKFIDRQDKEIYSSTISVSARIARGASVRWNEHLDASKLDEKSKRSLGEERANIKAVFHARKIFFVDGTVKKYELGS